MNIEILFLAALFLIGTTLSARVARLATVVTYGRKGYQGVGKGCRLDRLAGGQSCVNEYTLLNSFVLLKELREAMNLKSPYQSSSSLYQSTIDDLSCGR
jgi:hypothetical protein